MLPMLLAFFVCSCEKAEDPRIVDDTIKTEYALLRWEGDYSIDGCGFVFDMNETQYKAENDSIISDSLKSISGRKVEIEFKVLRQKLNVNCGDSKYNMYWKGITILNIAPR